jgi:hypothetical protein
MNSVLFKSQKFKCTEHNGTATFYCSCEEKLCRLCIQTHHHESMKIVTYHDTKNHYYEELRTVRQLLDETKEYESNINDNIAKVISMVLNDYLTNSLYIDENACIKEAKLLEFDEVPSFELMTETLSKKYSQKLRHCIISKLKKFGLIQNYLLDHIKSFKEEFGKLFSSLLVIDERNLDNLININKKVYYSTCEGTSSSNVDSYKTINETESDRSKYESCLMSQPDSLNASNIKLDELEQSLDISEYLEKVCPAADIVNYDNFDDIDFERRKISELIGDIKCDSVAKQSNYPISFKNCTECGVAFDVNKDTMRWKYRCDTCQKNVRKSRPFVNTNSAFVDKNKKVDTATTSVCFNCKENFVPKGGVKVKYCYKCNTKYKTYNNF